MGQGSKNVSNDRNVNRWKCIMDGNVSKDVSVPRDGNVSRDGNMCWMEMCFERKCVLD
jgi:hypothetical protein